MEHQLMNPLAQLFALIVEQLPGCSAPGGSWLKASDADREIAAIDYLFKDALAACDKTSKTRTLNHMFGANVTRAAGAAATTAAISTAASQKPIAERTRSKIETKKVQSTLTLTMQKLLLKAMENKKPDTKTLDI
jgi:hypothetical protein